MNLTLSENVVEWLRHGERGTSSETIVAHLTGFPTRDHGHPHDPDDLRRCRLVLEACPELNRPFLDRMGECSPAWARLVAIWDDLCELMDYEVAETRRDPKGPSAAQTYSIMRRALGYEATCHVCNRTDVGLTWREPQAAKLLEVHGVAPTVWVKKGKKYHAVKPTPERCAGSGQAPMDLP